MLCQFEKVIYPSSSAQIDSGSYMVALYRPCEKIKDASGNLVTQVKAVGYCLPVADNLRYEMQGHWSKHQNHGLQFEVEKFETKYPLTTLQKGTTTKPSVRRQKNNM